MIYYAPTKLFIDEDEKNIGKIISSYSFKKIMVLCGKKSVIESGLLDIVINSLNGNNIKYILYKGVKSNPSLDYVRSVYKNHDDVEMILAIGGGSVIDTAKSLAVSLAMNEDPWNFNSCKSIATKAIPIGVILTIAAAGSEMSSSCVITNEQTNSKVGFNSDLMRPLFAIMNPKLTFSVSKYQTACGIVDIMMHTLERYITDKPSEFADELSIALLKTVYNNGIIAYNDPTNYESRKALMLASSFSHNDLTQIGRDKYFRAHKFEHVISGFYPNVSHGAGLAVIWGAYARTIYLNKYALPRFLKIAYDVLNIKKTNDIEKDALKGIECLDDYFYKLGMPLSMEDLNIPYEKLEEFALSLSLNKTRIIPDIIPIDYERGKMIFSKMWKNKGEENVN